MDKLVGGMIGDGVKRRSRMLITFKIENEAGSALHLRCSPSSASSPTRRRPIRPEKPIDKKGRAATLPVGCLSPPTPGYLTCVPKQSWLLGRFKSWYRAVSLTRFPHCFVLTTQPFLLFL